MSGGMSAGSTSSASRGRLRLYLAVAPGAGKTYAMLAEAKRLAERGVDVVVGFVETHHRADSEAILTALEQIPLAQTSHRGHMVRSETIDGVGYPVNKPATAGWNGYGDFQHSTEEAIRMNKRAVVDRLTELVDKTGAEVVFVCGEVRGRTDVVSALPERVAARVCQLHAGALGRRIGEDEISDLIDVEFERRRRTEIADIAQRFQTEIGRRSGLAAEGLTAVCAALRAGDVDTLIVGELGDATLVTGEELTTVAPDADALSQLGEAPVRVVRADEALPFVAITIRASVVRVDDRIAPADGIGALLRYAPTGVLGDMEHQADRSPFSSSGWYQLQNRPACQADAAGYLAALLGDARCGE